MTDTPTADTAGRSTVADRRAARREEILDAADAILAEEGIDGLTMRRLADALGIRAPSLYKHVRDKDELLAALQERSLESMGREVRAAGDGLAALARAYRSWAVANPARYEVATGLPLARDRLTPGVEAWAAEPVLAAVRGDEHRARALWAAAHGLVDLEIHDRFPPGIDLDAAWAALVEAFST